MGKYTVVQVLGSTRNEVFYLGLLKSVYFWPHLLPLWSSLGIRENELNYNFAREEVHMGIH